MIKGNEMAIQILRGEIINLMSVALVYNLPSIALRNECAFIDSIKNWFPSYDNCDGFAAIINEALAWGRTMKSCSKQDFSTFCERLEEFILLIQILNLSMKGCKPWPLALLPKSSYWNVRIMKYVNIFALLSAACRYPVNCMRRQNSTNIFSAVSAGAWKQEAFADIFQCRGMKTF